MEGLLRLLVEVFAMTRPYGLLRIGFTYDRTIGMRRLTNTPVDIAVARDGSLYILCRGGGLGFVRHLNLDDDDLGAFNLLGGGAQIGGSKSVGGSFQWPAALVMDGDENLWISDEGTHKIACVTREGDLVKQWGEFGEGDGQLNRPSGIALDREGNIYVVDTQNHRVQKFTGDGAFLMKFGSFGAGEGEFNMPWGITVDDEGCVYVADWRNDRIQKFTADGVFIMKFGKSGSGDGQFNRPSGVAVDTDGDIYVSDRGNNRVQLFSAEGRFVEKFIGDATLGKQARSYMITNMVAMRLREMTAIEPQKRLRAPISVRVDGQGRMYVTDYGSHRVQVYQKEAIRLGEREIAAPLRSPTLYTQF
jgi:DNA-binding beta-propeller fold protein YncE